MHDDCRLEAPLRNVFPEHCLSLGVRRQWKRGEVIPAPEGPDPGFYMVISGQVRLVGALPDGERKVLFVAERGCYLYDAYFFCRLPSVTVAEVVRPAETVLFSGSVLVRLLNEDRVFLANALYNGMSRAVLMGLDLVDVCRARPGRYLLGLLLKMGLREGSRSAAGLEVRVTQDELAELVGVHRVTINRWLKRLEQDGSVSVGRGRILLRKT